LPDADLSYLSTTRLAALIRDRQLSPVELADHYLDRIQRLEPRINAFSFLDPEHVRAQAWVAERAVQNGDEIGPLHGVPIAIKDGIPVRDMPTTGCSHLMREFISAADSPIAARLRDAGAIVFGKTTMPRSGTKGLLTAFFAGSLAPRTTLTTRPEVPRAVVRRPSPPG